MKRSELKSLDQVVAEHRQDVEFRALWDSAAFAREVANRVVRYRTEKGLSQRDLAAMVDMVQPQIARLERAEHQPSVETLVKLSRAIGLEFHLQVVGGDVELTST
jgi:ribosome-binding protein aMBF1 (putative translation factor)